MGWERKRGKLLEFNRLLRGDRETSYAVLSADPASLPRIRFVITLDADTQMPRDTAGRLVGTLAHPLNRPRFDAADGRVVEGYGVLQPRVSFHLTAATHSRFAALLAASGGHRPVLDGGLRRLHGPLRRRQLHRQGDLRRRRLRGGHGRDVPREPDPQPRPDRGELRALRPGQRHRALRRLPGPLPRLRPPRAPLGPRRLAAPALAGPAGADARGVASQPAAAPRALEAASTTSAAASCRPRSWCCWCWAGRVLPGSPWLWTAAALAALALPLFQSILGSAGRQRSRPVAVAGFLNGLGGLPAVIGQVVLDVDVPGQSGRVSARRDRPHARAAVLDAAEAAGMGDRRVDRAAAAEGSLHFVADMWPAPALAVAIGALVFRAATGGAAGGRSRSWPPGSSRRPWPSGSASRGERSRSP